MDRKEFIKTSLALMGAGIAGTALFLESCKKTNTSPQGPSANFTLDLTAPANAALKNPGGYVYNSGVIVACVAAGSYVAVAQACTHAGCTIAYGGNSRFNCPCHGGVFDTNGNVVSGPPPTPLKKYTVTQSGNTLTVTG